MNYPATRDTITKRWIPLKLAAFYSHIGKDRLRRLATEGKIKGWPDPDSKRGDWIFDILSIDAYRENQDPRKNIKEKALEILRGVKL